MKKYLLVPGLLVSALSTFGQSTTRFEHSVYHNATPSSIALKSKLTTTGWKAKLPGWMAEADQVSGMPRDLYGTPINLPGTTTQDKFNYCITNIVPSLGVNATDLVATGTNETPVGYFSRYKYQVNGRTVVFSSLMLKLTSEGKLADIQNKYYGNNIIATTPSITKEDALAAALSDLGSATINQQSVDANWVWFPVPGNGGYELHPAYPFSISGKDKTAELQLTGYVDGTTGELLYRTNDVKETFNASIVGSVYKQNPTLPATTEPLADLLLTINGNSYYTDSTGNVNIPSLPLPQTANVALKGRWSTVRAALNSNATASYMLTDSVSTLLVDTFRTNITASSLRHVNAFYHVNRVHDFMKFYYPAFLGMDISLPTNVDVTGSCNAYYNGSSINFYAAGSGCNSFTICGDIIYHEYGHGISDKFYNAQGAGTINNGALNEANSDIWGISITHNPILGQGSYTSGSNNYIRRYDQTPKVYPKDIVGEVHADGEIIAGAWWDVAVNIGSIDTMTKIFTRTYYYTPNGPNGTEGVVFHDVLMAALKVDDNDNNLSNGTPHFIEIVTAFAKHGINLLYGIQATSGEHPHSPQGVTIPVTGGVSLSNPFFLQSMKLFYKNRTANTWDSSVLTIDTAALTFAGQIPAQVPGTIIDYYVAVYDIAGITSAYLPDGYNPKLTSTQSTIPYQFGVGIYAKDSNNFENSTTGWQIGNVAGDNATNGLWINDVPVGSFTTSASGTLPCQPGYDHTTGAGKCLVTGNAVNTTQNINTADVDNGSTSVITPPIVIDGFTNPVIEYYRWYSNDRGSNPRNDRWMVYMKDTLSSFWFITVDQTYQSDYHWRRRILSVRDYLSSASAIQLKFVASDPIQSSLTGNGQSTVEAGIDDFYIYDAAFTTGIKNEEHIRASVYPNPANDNITVSLSSGITEGMLSLYDVMGRKVTEQNITANTKLYQFSTGKLMSGHYTLLIKTAKSVESKGIIITH